MAKNAWTRAEYALLLRAWQEVLEEDEKGGGSGHDPNGSEKTLSTSVRVYHHFMELSKNTTSQRSLNAINLQRAVLSFNFTFILQYNLQHGASAWVSLSRDQREEVYNREKSTSYYFVDLDPAMLAILAVIRKRIASNSSSASGAAASVPTARPKGRPPKRATLPPTEAAPVTKSPRRGQENVRQVYRTVIDAKGSDEEDESSSSDSSSGDDESESSVDKRAKAKKSTRMKIAKMKRGAESKKSVRVGQAAILDILDALKRDVRRIEKAVTGGNHRGSRHGAASVMSNDHKSEKIESRRPTDTNQKPRLQTDPANAGQRNSV